MYSNIVVETRGFALHTSVARGAAWPRPGVPLHSSASQSDGIPLATTKNATSKGRNYWWAKGNVKSPFYQVVYWLLSFSTV